MGHHYVPQYYLRGFAVGDSIWAYDKTLKRSFPSQVKSIANENSMYSEELESYLATHVEDPAKEAISKLRTEGRISTKERHALAQYIVVMWKRVPRARSRAFERLPEVTRELEEELGAQIDQLVAEDPSLADKAEARRSEISAILERQRKNPAPEIWYRSLDAEGGSKVVDALLSMNWIFLHSRQQFLTCDNPVFFFEHEGISKPTSELTFPISSSVALWASRLPRPNMHHVAVSPTGLREINRRTVHNSTRFVYAQENETWILPFVLKRHWQITRLR